MVKNLRSLIHEVFPFELRVELELLSRRRDICNEEKQDELLNLLRKYEIQNVSQLGPGTNRYAARINGFVVKFATDHDGKIDNMKEFKMAKRFYPHVTKIYEVSENGTLLVAEYIQPFTSYSEMLKYADKIRAILSEIASVYLIGDVGISELNYSNWGLRIGSEDPVCLDFAYAYEVSSNLFICRRCNAQAMLAPNKDYSYLICSNPACAKKTTFEDIRGLIGNDIHRHEIGDLSKEGYLLSESNVETVLDEERSNYLAVKSNNHKKRGRHVISSNNNDENDVQYYENDVEINKEENEMDNFSKFQNLAANITVRNVTAAEPTPQVSVKPTRPERTKMSITVRNVTAAEPTVDRHEPNDQNVQGQPVTEGSPVAFSGPVVSGDQKVYKAYAEDSNAKRATILPRSTPYQYQPRFDEYATSVPTQPTDVVTPSVTEPPVEESTVAEPQQPVEVPSEGNGDSLLGQPTINPRGYQFDHRFVSNSSRSVSWLANRISEHLHVIDMFGECKGYIKDKRMNAEQFYKSVQNAVYRSLVSYLDFSEKDVPNKDNPNRTHKEFRSPDITKVTDDHKISTWRFIETLYMGFENVEDPVDMLDDFRDTYGTDMGISVDWIQLLSKKIPDKLSIYNNGVDKIVAVIEKFWCPIQKQDPDETQVPTQPTDVVTPSVTEPPVEESTVAEPQQPVEVPSEGNGEYQLSDGESITPNGDEEDDEYLSVEIFLGANDNTDIIRICDVDNYGTTVIPMYASLSDIVTEDDIGELNENRYFEANGVWDWLANMVPAIAFTTKSPGKWMQINDIDTGDDQSKIVIIDKEDDWYIMGIYYITGIFITDNNGDRHSEYDESLLSALNELFMENLNGSALSYRPLLLSSSEDIHSEDYMYSLATPEMKDILDRYVDATEQTIIDTINQNAIYGAMGSPSGNLPDDSTMQTVVKRYSPDNNQVPFTGPIGPDGTIHQIDGKYK